MDSNIQKKLFHYTEMPPRSTWDSIAATLEECPAYAQKLDRYEEAPPAGVWEAVAKQLAPAPANVILFRTKVFKYAIAAAVLGLIAAGSLLYLKSGVGSNLAKQPQNAVPIDVNNTTTRTQAPSGVEIRATEKNVAAVEIDADVSTSTATVSDHALVPYSTRVRIAKNRMATRAIAIMPEVKTKIDTELANRYMIATTSAGKVVRLPKKAYSDYVCAEAYKNYQCKEKIASIQSKMAASVATDFTEFMDLLKKLQEVQ
jgi:hypothetical protein